MKKSKIGLTIILLIVFIIGSCLLIHRVQMNSLFKKTSSELFDINNESLEEILDNASTFKIQKQIFSLKKHYFITVDNVVVGEVTGKLLRIFGDRLEMTDAKGNIVKSEYQIKRFGPTNGSLFNLSFSRLAEIKDSAGTVTGYIGEEKLKDFWKLTHRQYFYNKNAEQIGSAKPDFFILSKDYKISDTNDNIDYIVDGNIFSLSSKATITKNENADVDEESVIFYTIIENSIIDSKTSDSSSSDSSKKK